jgi:hypothetical protein
MNLINKVGNISIKVEDFGVDIQIEGISVETQDVNPVEYVQVAKAKKEQLEAANETIKSSIALIKEVASAAKATSSAPAGLDLGSILKGMEADLKAAKEGQGNGGIKF